MDYRLKRLLLYALFIVNLAAIFIFWWLGSGALFSKGFANMIVALGRLSGLLAVYSVLLQVLLIGRTVWIERSFGMDKLSRLHHKIGIASMAMILLHPIFLATGYGLNAKTSFPVQLWDFILYWQNVLIAAIALVLFLIVVILSVWFRKKMKYESWYYIHLIVYAAILLAFFHQLEIGGDFMGMGAAPIFRIYWYALYIFVIINLLIFRFGRILYNLIRYDFRISEIVRENDNTVSIFLSSKNMDNFRISPGQFMIMRILSKRLWLEAHPFSLSRYDYAHGNYLRATIKVLGDFTAKVPNIQPNTRVLIDGPHGIFTSKSAIKDKFLFIAGGVGITPIRSLVEELGMKTRDCIVFYACRLKKDILFQKEFDELAKRHPNVKMIYVLSHEKDWNGEKGFVDKEKLLRYVEDIRHRDIYICGPTPMMDSVLKSLKEMGVDKKNIHYENFSF